MEFLKTLSKSINTLFPFADFLYILQQEEYSNSRLLRWLPRFFLRRNFQVRGKLAYTQRVKTTLLLCILIWTSTLIIAYMIVDNVFIALLIIVMWSLGIPYFVMLGNFLASLIYERIKNGIKEKAIAKVKANPKLKVIAIAGSFGKTTVKNFILQMIQYSFKTQMLPGNINTAPGIAGWVASNLHPTTEVLIMEVDAYMIGEITRSCSVAPADIACILNFGDQHLERLKDHNTLVSALTETFTASKESAILMARKETWNEIDADLGNRERIIINENTIQYQNQPVTTPKLSASNSINIVFALKVAELLNVPKRFIDDSLQKLELPDRRQRQTTLFGYSAIDDSYNISYTTAQAGILAAGTAAKEQRKKLLVITAGIPELGDENKDKNKNIGTFLENNADHTIILNSFLAKDVQMGFTDKTKYTLESSLKSAVLTLDKKFPKDEWFLLLQPELNDLYY